MTPSAHMGTGHVSRALCRFQFVVKQFCGVNAFGLLQTVCHIDMCLLITHGQFMHDMHTAPSGLVIVLWRNSTAAAASCCCCHSCCFRCGSSFDVAVVSDLFEGKMLIARHRLVSCSRSTHIEQPQGLSA